MLLMSIWTAVSVRLHREDGATMVEYGLMVALVAIVAIAGVTLLGTSLRTLFTNTANSL